MVSGRVTAALGEVSRDHLGFIILFIYVSNPNIVLKYPLFYFAVWHHHGSFTMLDAVYPCALIVAAISPSHLALAMSLVFGILAIVYVARCPSEEALAMFFIIEIITIVGGEVLRRV